MNLTGLALRVHVPEFVRRRALCELYEATAGAFGARPPALDGATGDEVLRRYAEFTAERTVAVLESGEDWLPIRQRLYDSALGIGTRLRRDLGVRSVPDAMAAARVVYGMLGIDFTGTADGDVGIRRCYFSRFYSAPSCRLMSALDQGLLAGLTGGRRLEFRQRITEGAAWCGATLSEVST